MGYRIGCFAAQYADSGPAAQSRFSRRGFLTLILGGGLACGAEIRPALCAPDGPASFLADAVAVEDGRALRLADGRRLLLPHILPPGPDRHAPMTDTAPIRIAARALADLALGRRLRVDLDDPAQDRHGRLRARVAVGGRDVAAALCRLGMVRVFPEPGADPRRVIELIGAEMQGRAADAGFWRDGYFAHRPAVPAEIGVDQFEIVTGTVGAVSRIGSRDHLEFGADWRSDFTAGLASGIRRALTDEGVEVADLAGRTVTVRGWVRFWNGPYMEVPERTGLTLP